MMELAHSLTLNEQAVAQIAETKRPIFVFEWLRFLDKVLVAAQKSDINECQKKLLGQLLHQLTETPGPPMRRLIAKNLAALFGVGDTFDLFQTVNKCNDILKNKDDSPSYLPTRLTAIACIGEMHSKLGRMMGRSFEETVLLLIKSLKNSESQGRMEIMMTLQKILAGLGSAAVSCHKDVYKATRSAMTDRSMSVRAAAAKCMLELSKEAQFMYTTELDANASLCFRALDGSNYDVRCAVSCLLGELMAKSQDPKLTSGSKAKPVSIDDALGTMASGFLRGGFGFLKGTEMIKGSSTSREVRVGVTHAYVRFVEIRGGLWLERNISLLLKHLLLDLVANPRASASHVDAVYSRKCVNFVLRTVLGELLGEKAQISAAKELCHIILQQMNLLGDATTDKDSSVESLASQHVLVCALHELSSIVQHLGTSAGPLVSEPSTGIIAPVMAVLIHQSLAARLAAAWSLRSIAVALPLQLCLLIDRCVERMESLKSSPEAIGGYSCALAALIGGVSQCPLGMPHSKSKQIFGMAEDLLRIASQNSRLSLHRTQAGWLLLGALMTLGPAIVKAHLPRMLLFWKNTFPRSSKELESERARGDAFTWQVTLEARAGALASMYSFLLHCPELVTDDVTRRLRTPTDAALVMLANLTSMLKSYGAPLKANAAMVRLKLYQTLSLIPPESYEGSYSSLLRELVAEFTLTDNPSNTTTSMLRSMCHHDDSVILGSWLQETDHKAIEDQLQPNSASGSGALEHDMSYVYLKCPEGESMPGPLPLGVAVIDKSMHLFGIVFPRVTHNKHRVQMLEHFMECIRQAKSSRQEAVQMNIFTAFLAAMKGLVETKGSLGQDDVKKAAIQLIMSALASSNPILRCAAGEALGRMAQVVGDNRFVADMAQFSFDKLKSARDVVTRTGHSLALGCLHKYVGGLSTGQHLNTSVSILLALAQDSTSPAVQVWALHALALIADSGGPMFRGYVEPTLSLCLRLMLSVPPSNTDVHQCLGKCLSALITTVGPELQANTSPIITARSSFLVACAVMQDHSDSLVQAEAIACLQQLHMFAPRHVNLSTLVPKLCVTLSSPHLLLRRAAVACLRQLSHREAPEVCEYAMTLVDSKDWKIDITETGLEGMLFAMLDTENDRSLVSDIHDTLISMLQSLAGENLTRWLALCKQVLSASSEFMLSPEEEAAAAREEADDDAGAEATFKAGEEPESHPLVAARWPTRVFAVDCMQKIVAVCKDDSAAHFDLALARKHKQHNVKSDFLVLHLPELVRMTFISATSDSDQLRMAGLKALQNVITTFSRVPEPEFPGHFILEQFQAQVGAALRPAFSPDTGPNVTAAACQVCSTWIGSGVACDLNDLRRVHQLLVSSLAKLKSGKGSSSQLYSETAATMEKLAVLKAWAEVYIVAMETDKADKSKVSTPVDDEEDEDFADFQGVAGGESLLSLVTPELVSLSKHWLAALKDYALLSLPPEFASQLPPEGGAFYKAETIESTRPLYRDAWYPIVHAAALWLNNGGFENVAAEREKVDVEGSTNLGLGAANASATKVPDEINTDRFHLIQGICVEALCSPRTVHPVECVMACLNALHQLLDKPWSRSVIGQDQSLGVELLNVLHRLLLTRELASTQTLVIDVARQVLKTAQEHLELAKRVKAKEADLPANQDLESPLVGEGGESGEIVIGKSLVFAFLEVCMCLLVRHMPQLNPALPTAAPPQQQQQPRREVAPPLTPEAQQLVGSAVHIMSELPALCTPHGSLNVLPTVLILTTGVLKYTSPRQIEETVAPSTACTSALHSLKHLTAHPMARDRSCGDTWVALLRSSLTTILDFAEPDPTTNWPGMDETVTMLALAVFIVSSPPEVVCVPILHDKCVNVFREALEAKYHVVRIKCLQTVASIFQHPSRAVATPYIHGLASLVLKHLYAASLSKNGLSEPDVAVIVEETKVVETLVHLAEEEHRITLLKILVPLLVSYLLDSSKLPSSSRAQKLLHERSLQKLMEIGPKFPEQFRAVMAGAPPVRTALEDAVKFSQQRSAASATKQAQDKFISQQQSAPSIKLKMDFSNFSG